MARYSNTGKEFQGRQFLTSLRLYETLMPWLGNDETEHGTQYLMVCCQTIGSWSSYAYPNISADCVLCSRAEEDFVHLFCLCPFAHMIGAIQGIPSVDATSERAFWDSVQRGGSKWKEGGRILSVLRAI